MKIVYIFLLLLVLPTQVSALKLTKLNVDLNYPWGMTWISEDKLLITEKKSHEIIPMCHPLLLTGIDISFEKHQKPDPETGLCSITITGTVKVTGQTGVEMEALTAVSTAALTIYDMCKAVDRGMYFDKIGLIHKSGGKSGTYEKKAVGQ